MNTVVVERTLLQVRIDRVYDVSDVPLDLVDEDHAGVSKLLSDDQSQKIIVERHEDPLVFVCKFQVVSIRLAAHVIVAGDNLGGRNVGALPRDLDVVGVKRRVLTEIQGERPVLEHGDESGIGGGNPEFTYRDGIS